MYYYWGLDIRSLVLQELPSGLYWLGLVEKLQILAGIPHECLQCWISVTDDVNSMQNVHNVSLQPIQYCLT